MCYQHLPEEFHDENSIYFLRNTPGMVPLPNSVEEANEMLPAYFEFGILNGHSLVMLEQIIGQVYWAVELLLFLFFFVFFNVIIMFLFILKPSSIKGVNCA
jgi:hypothetical protein